MQQPNDADRDDDRKRAHDEGVSDSGGDSDPGAAAGASPTGEDEAARNRDEEPPA